MRIWPIIATTIAAFSVISPPRLHAAAAETARFDDMLVSVSYRILAANAPLCRRLMPGIGASLISRDQFPSWPSDIPHPAFPGDGSVAVAATSSRGPAHSGGLRPGDSVWLVAGMMWPMKGSDHQFLYQTAFSTLANRDPDEPFSMSYSRGGYLMENTVDPVPSCRVLAEILPSENAFARADKEIVQISSALAADLTPDNMAVVFAHELGHVILEHRRRLDAAGVKKGLLAEFGKNAVRNRRAEVEADRLSVHLLANAGYDPRLAPTFWRSEIGAQRDGGWMRSRAYPARESRAASMDTEIAHWSLTAGNFSSAAPLISWREQSIDIDD